MKNLFDNRDTMLSFSSAVAVLLKSDASPDIAEKVLKDYFNLTDEELYYNLDAFF